MTLQSISSSAGPTFSTPTQPRLIARPLSTRAQDHHRSPAAGEVHLWRFQSHWIPVQPAIAHAWLGSEEWESVRRHGTPAARRRFLTTRVSLRWILSGIADVQPNDPCLQFASVAGQAALQIALGVENATNRQTSFISFPLFIDIAQTGAWTLIALAPMPLALHVGTAPAPTTGKPAIDSFETSAGKWPLTILPMPAPALVGLTSQTAPSIIRGFGWRAGEILPAGLTAGR